MKHLKLYSILGLEALLLVVFTFFSTRTPGLVSSIFAFPFEQIAALLKVLARTGAFGNGLALALGIAISLLPIVFLLNAKRSTPVERFACIFTSIVMMIGLYGMVNPSGFLPEELRETMGADNLAKGFLGVCIWSFLILCLILHYIRVLRKSDILSLKKIMIYGLVLISALFTASVVMGNLAGLLQSLKPNLRLAELLFEILRFLTAAVPAVLNIWVCVTFMDLLSLSMEKEVALGSQVRKVMTACSASLVSAALLQAVFNLLQLRFIGYLSNVNAAVSVPVASMAFALLILLVSRLMVENKQLQDDQDLFI